MLAAAVKLGSSAGRKEGRKEEAESLSISVSHEEGGGRGVRVANSVVIGRELRACVSESLKGRSEDKDSADWEGEFQLVLNGDITVRLACEVHNCKVFSDVRSTFVSTEWAVYE